MAPAQPGCHRRAVGLCTRHGDRFTGGQRMSNDDRAPGCRIGRRQFLAGCAGLAAMRSEEHTSELQSLMRISYAVFCLKKKKKNTKTTKHDNKRVYNIKNEQRTK